MLKGIIYSMLFAFLSCTVTAQTAHLHSKEWKRKMFLAVENTKIADSLYQIMVKENKKDALSVGYLGTLQTLKAKHFWNPYQKLKFVKLGMNNLNSAIKMKPNDLELYFLRFTVQYFIPSFLGYSKELKSDKLKILTIIKTEKFEKDQLDVVENTARFFKEHNVCDPKELPIISKYAKM